MICDIGGNDNFYIIILIFIEKHIYNIKFVIVATSSQKMLQSS